MMEEFRIGRVQRNFTSFRFSCEGMWRPVRIPRKDQIAEER